MSVLAKQIGDKGTVAILACNQDDPSLQKRVEGVREEAKKHVGIKILDVYYSEDTPAGAAATVEQVLQAHPEITSWAMVCGEALSTDNAFKWQPGSIKVVAVDSLRQSDLGYLKSGHVQTVLFQPAMEWGQESVRILYEKVAENKDPPSFVIGDLTPITKDNVEVLGKNLNLETWLPKK